MSNKEQDWSRIHSRKTKRRERDEFLQRDENTFSGKPLDIRIMDGWGTHALGDSGVGGVHHRAHHRLHASLLSHFMAFSYESIHTEVIRGSWVFLLNAFSLWMVAAMNTSIQASVHVIMHTVAFRGSSQWAVFIDLHMSQHTRKKIHSRALIHIDYFESRQAG